MVFDVCKEPAVKILLRVVRLGDPWAMSSARRAERHYEV
jgi:hypothetical protein